MEFKASEVTKLSIIAELCKQEKWSHSYSLARTLGNKAQAVASQIKKYSLTGQVADNIYGELAKQYMDRLGVKPKPSSNCYQLIKAYYGDKKAKRSGVPYINHIDEGIGVLTAIYASWDAINAYCIHPILQEDSILAENMNLVREIPWRIVMLAMEYRNVANRGLLSSQIDNPDDIYLSPLGEVNDMLIADKVQNRKDFLIHHYGTHPKSKELDRYFRNWLRALDVTEKQYDDLVKAIEYAKMD